MSAVWVVRDAEGNVIGTSVVAGGAVRDVVDHCGRTTRRVMAAMGEKLKSEARTDFYECSGFTITRETLITPEHERVIAAAKALSAAASAMNDAYITGVPFKSRRFAAALDQLAIANVQVQHALRAQEGV